MSYINADTKKVELNAKRLSSLSKKYEEHINAIKDILSKDDYWNGEDNEYFKQDLKESCEVYDKVYLILNQYASFLDKYSKNIEKEASLDIIK